MSLTLVWQLLVAAAALTGLTLIRGWVRGDVTPPQNRVVMHGVLGMLALGVFLAGYAPDGVLARPQLVALVLVIASGAMMFGARRRDRRCPRPLLYVHLTSCAGLLVSLL